MQSRRGTERCVISKEMAVAQRYTILRCVVGSTIHGLNAGDQTEDRDEMGICVETPEQSLGLTGFEQAIYRSAAERTGNVNERSMAGDLDLVIYGLRKYVRLTLSGNPTLLTLLFAPEQFTLLRTGLGKELQEMASCFVSRSAGKAFHGYLVAQRMRLTGERGQKDVNRPELVAKYGWDVKYGMHMLRLGYQGVELLTTGRLVLPMEDPVRSYLRDVRFGKVSMQEALTKAGELEVQLGDLVHDESGLPMQPDRGRVERWLVDSTLRYWESLWQRVPGQIDGGS